MAMRARTDSPRAAAIAAAVLIVSATLPAQSSVVHWGAWGSHTDSMRGSVAFATANFVMTGIVDLHGDVFLSGQTPRIRQIPAFAAGSVVQLAITLDVAAALLSDGTITVWGQSPILPATPAPALPPGVTYVSIEAGMAHFLAVRSDGAVVAWGYNAYGECNVPPLAGPAVQVEGGTGWSMALLANGSIVAWGNNSDGQCVPPPPPPGMTYKRVSAGSSHGLALRSDGEIVAWGSNASGQCNVPPRPPGIWHLLCAAGQHHSVAYRSDGLLVAWGGNHVGQLNVPVLTERLRALTSGLQHVLAVTVSGRVHAWGDNGFHQAAVPYLPESPAGVRHRAIATTNLHAVVVLSDGSIQSWGDNYYNQIPVPAALASSRFTKVGAGFTHTIALRDDGNLFAWGANNFGQCNVPPLPPLVTYRDMAVSDNHAVALRSDGSAVAFGPDAFGCTAIPALPTGVTYTDVDVRYGKSLLVRSDGALAYAGTQWHGDHLIPPLPSGLRYVEASCAHTYSLALRSDGTVVAWGSFVSSSLAWRPIPTLPTGVYYVEVDGGYGFTILRRSDGQVVTCGIVGDVFTAPPLQPGTSYVEVTAGNDTCAARVGPTSTYVGIAPGCSGSRPAARLVPRDTPHIGRTLEVTLFDVPEDLALLAFGWQQIAPLSLASVGAPGCLVHVQVDATALLSGQGNQVRWQLPIPFVPSLVGIRFYNQALVLDANAGNGLGAVLSDAAEAVVGAG